MFAILDDEHNVIPADINEWSAWLKDDDEKRRVAVTTVGAITISTIFLGTDHGFGSVPQWFESMVFGEKDVEDERQWRYETWDQAVAGHKALCALTLGITE